MGAEDKVVDLMAALEKSVADAKARRRERERLRQELLRVHGVDHLDSEISDSFGSVWEKCEHPDCDLNVVRPGKVQCSGMCE